MEAIGPNRPVGDSIINSLNRSMTGRTFPNHLFRSSIDTKSMRWHRSIVDCARIQG
jgi:hypothetical protein